MKLGYTTLPVLGLFTSLIAAPLTGAIATTVDIPHPIPVVPDFHCASAQGGSNGETAESCLQKAQLVLQESFATLDIQRAEKPDLDGPSDYWGQCEYTPVDQRVPTVAILMHGMFEDGRQLAPEAAWLAKQGIPVLNLVLAGHGLTNELANEVLYTDWIEEAERAMRIARAIGDRVILVGHSTGGALSVYLGIKYPEAVAAAVLIEPAVRVSTLVQTAACVSQHGISNIADYPALLKVYGSDPDKLHNRVIAPAAGCEVKNLRTAALGLLAQNRWGKEDLDQSRALGEAFKAPLLLFNNKHDIVVDTDQNEAFAEGVALHGISKTITFNLDRKTPHGSITFSHVDWILSELAPFLKTQGILRDSPQP
jgi:alpha-beta hydrolase superfamily lysophospholipase